MKNMNVWLSRTRDARPKFDVKKWKNFLNTHEELRVS